MTEPGRQLLPMEIGTARGTVELAPAWREFIRFCSELGHGEIERLSIQDGVPVLAETIKRKVKFHAREPRAGT